MMAQGTLILMSFSYSALSSLSFMTPYPLALASIIPAFEDSSKFSKFHFTSPSGEFKRSQ